MQLLKYFKEFLVICGYTDSALTTITGLFGLEIFKESNLTKWLIFQNPVTYNVVGCVLRKKILKGFICGCHTIALHIAIMKLRFLAQRFLAQ